MTPGAMMGRVRALLIAASAASLLCAYKTADDPADRLPNPAQEARARHLFQGLRCVQCQNESIDDSQADIAQDLRRIVRGQIAQGRTDKEIRDFLVQRYGEFILLTPTLSPGNLLLWGTPFLVILLGGAYIWIKSREPAVEDEALSDEEQKALEEMDAVDKDMLPPHSGQTNTRGAAVHGVAAIKQ